MRYDLTEKLKFSEDPVLVIRDTEFTIRSDAETVLRLMDVVTGQGEAAAAREAAKLLLSEKDQKKLAGLGLKLEDYMTVLRTAMALAAGNDPEEAARGE